MNNQETYIDGAINVSEVQLEAYKLDDIDSVSDFIPSEREVNLKNALYNDKYQKVKFK